MAFEKHLLVDGANIVHAWPELRVLLKRDRDSARALLVQRLATLHDVESVRVTIVFDGRGDELTVECPAGPATLAVVYTPAGVTADDVIEQLVARSVPPSLCTVATGDGAERQTITAAGGWWISPEDLRAWIERVSRRQEAQVAGLRRSVDAQWRRK